MPNRFGLRHELITTLKVWRQRYYATRITHRTKVFGIGLSRTGTKSLHHALTYLGYRSEHFPAHLLKLVNGALTLDLDGVRHYEAMTDTVASAFYRELDQRFPGSKFILTVRDIDPWLRSCSAHFASMQAEPISASANAIRLLRMQLYGSEDFDAEKFRKAYQNHINQIKSYFDGRDDLLVIDICGGQDWLPLCRFLGVAPNGGAFPWANRRST
jgi:hypothetical protein